MASSDRRLLAPVAALLLAAGGCTLRSSLPEMGAVPAFTLTSQDNRTVTRETLQDKIWVVDFIFTTCNGPCPRMSAQMKRLQGMLDPAYKDVRLVSITVDPKHDTPAVLAEYAQHFRADQGVWWFLTGTPEQIQALSVGTFHVNTAVDQLQHSTRFILVDRKARIRGYYESADASTLDQLAADIGALRREML